jgi:hypothetical protein
MRKSVHSRGLGTFLLVPLVLLGSLLFSACAASRMMMRYGDLETKTEVSESVFLDLRSGFPKTVHVSESSSVSQDLTVLESVQRDLTAAGYRLVESPGEATYLIQISHIQLAAFELEEGQELTDAITAAFAAGAVGGITAGLLGASRRTGGKLGVVTGLVAFIADAKTERVAHALTTDVLVTEMVPGGGGGTESRYHETRIVSAASKVNLDLGEALPAIVEGMSEAVSGLMPAVGT